MISYVAFVSVNMQITEMQSGRHREHRTTSRRKLNARAAIRTNSNNLVRILIAVVSFVTWGNYPPWKKSNKYVREIRSCKS
jgi:hypothetical protein